MYLYILITGRLFQGSYLIYPPKRNLTSKEYWQHTDHRNLELITEFVFMVIWNFFLSVFVKLLFVLVTGLLACMVNFEYYFLYCCYSLKSRCSFSLGCFECWSELWLLNLCCKINRYLLLCLVSRYHILVEWLVLRQFNCCCGRITLWR